jgi:hypothetical protein
MMHRIYSIVPINRHGHGRPAKISNSGQLSKSNQKNNLIISRDYLELTGYYRWLILGQGFDKTCYNRDWHRLNSFALL